MNLPLPDLVGGIRIERRHSLSTQVPLAGTARAVLHTTEGSFESAMAVFASPGEEPNLLIGRDSAKKLRMIEYGGVGAMAKALLHPAGTPETNRNCRYQIEVAGFRQVEAEIKTAPDNKTMDTEFRQALAAVFEQVARLGGVPLRRGGDGTRSLSRWQTQPGWFGHLEVPNNDHTDPGAHEYAKTFLLAMGPEFRVLAMDGEGKQLARSATFVRGELVQRLPRILRGFADEIRPELWKDGDVILRLRKEP